MSALVVGYEVAHRVGRCWHDHHDIYQACGSWESVANAAVASRVMGLDEMKRLGGKLPKTEEEAQFNVAWPLAVYLTYGEVSPCHMLQEALSDQNIIAMARKISVTESEAANKAHQHDSYPCRVEIVMDNGRRLDSGMVHYKHSRADETESEFGDYTSHDAVAAKFLHIAAPVAGHAAVHDLLTMVENLDSLKDLTSFFALLRGNGENKNR